MSSPVQPRVYTGTCSKCGRIEAPSFDAIQAHKCGAKSAVLGAPAAPSRKADGLDAEVELAKQLVAAGLHGWHRQYAWALDATPPRKFAADFAWPDVRLIVEIKGSAHRVTVEKVYQDCERESLAVALGWRVLPVHRGMVRDGTAVERIKDALGAMEAT